MKHYVRSKYIVATTAIMVQDASWNDVSSDCSVIPPLDADFLTR